MAINRATFKRGAFKKRANSRTEHPVYTFLAKNPGKAFLADEIIKSVKMNKDTVRGMLGKLVADGLVIHKQPYWAIARRN